MSIEFYTKGADFMMHEQNLSSKIEEIYSILEYSSTKTNMAGGRRPTEKSHSKRTVCSLMSTAPGKSRTPKSTSTSTAPTRARLSRTVKWSDRKSPTKI